MARYGNVVGGPSENVSYGFNDAFEILSKLIIDDGNPDRGHRKNIFNPTKRVHRCFTGPHAFYKFTTTQNFAVSTYGFGEKSPYDV